MGKKSRALDQNSDSSFESLTNFMNEQTEYLKDGDGMEIENIETEEIQDAIPDELVNFTNYFLTFYQTLQFQVDELDHQVESSNRPKSRRHGSRRQNTYKERIIQCITTRYVRLNSNVKAHLIRNGIFH